VAYQEVISGADIDGEAGDPLEVLCGDQTEDSHEDRLVRIEEMKQRLAGLSPDARRLITALLLSEREASAAPAPKLRELAAGCGIAGPALKEVKQEILAKFGVRWV
jgi:hypothetical protein